jgi:hypothetical protein
MDLATVCFCVVRKLYAVNSLILHQAVSFKKKFLSLILYSKKSNQPFVICRQTLSSNQFTQRNKGLAFADSMLAPGSDTSETNGCVGCQ